MVTKVGLRPSSVQQYYSCVKRIGQNNIIAQIMVKIQENGQHRGCEGPHHREYSRKKESREREVGGRTFKMKLCSGHNPFLKLTMEFLHL